MRTNEDYINPEDIEDDNPIDSDFEPIDAFDDLSQDVFDNFEDWRDEDEYPDDEDDEDLYTDLNQE